MQISNEEEVNRQHAKSLFRSHFIVSDSFFSRINIEEPLQISKYLQIGLHKKPLVFRWRNKKTTMQERRRRRFQSKSSMFDFLFLIKHFFGTHKRKRKRERERNIVISALYKRPPSTNVSFAVTSGAARTSLPFVIVPFCFLLLFVFFSSSSSCFFFLQKWTFAKKDYRETHGFDSLASLSLSFSRKGKI